MIGNQTPTPTPICGTQLLSTLMPASTAKSWSAPAKKRHRKRKGKHERARAKTLYKEVRCVYRQMLKEDKALAHTSPAPVRAEIEAVLRTIIDRRVQVPKGQSLTDDELYEKFTGW